VPIGIGVQAAPSQPFHGGRILARKLRSEGIEFVFTLTGGHISPIYDGCAREGGFRLIDVRHEQAAAHAADAYARLNRRPAVAAVTAGPGLTGAITGIANAFYAGSPVVLLGGRNPLSLEGMGSLQDAPQAELLRPVTKRVDVAFDAWRLGEVLHYAFSVARSPRPGPVYVDLPLDVQLTEVDPESCYVPPPSTYRCEPGPDPDLTAEVARRLSRAKNPVVVAGSGAYWSGVEEELKALLETAHLPLYVNGQARGIVPSTHPQLFTLTRRAALAATDMLLVLGADFDFRLGYGRNINSDAFVVHVDTQADKIGQNRPVNIGIVSNIRLFARELLRHSAIIGRGRPRAATIRLRTEEQRKRKAAAAEMQSDQEPVHPKRFAAEVAAFLDKDAVVIADGGDIAATAASVINVNHPGHWLDPGPFGCLGVGVPFAMAARLTHPGRQIVTIFGDGAFGFNAFEYDSAVRQKLPFVGVIGNDGAWGEMRTFHEKLFGADHMEAQYLSQSTRYDRVVEALGGHGERVTRPGDIRPALERAAASGVPSVVDVVLDPTYRRWGGAVGEDLQLPWKEAAKDAEAETLR
jgi:acetolactate synthase I/II/III large subunit